MIVHQCARDHSCQTTVVLRSQGPDSEAVPGADVAGAGAAPAPAAGATPAAVTDPSLVRAGGAQRTIFRLAASMKKLELALPYEGRGAKQVS